MTVVKSNPTFSLLDGANITSRPKRVSFLLGVLVCLSLMAISNQIPSLFRGSNGLKGVISQSASQNELDASEDQEEIYEFTGIENAEWCVDPKYEALPFENCRFKEFMFRIPVLGGLTNALNFILRGVIWAYEEDVCFFVEEKGPNPAQMASRDPPLKNIDPFMERYFEPFSLPRDHKKVQSAMNQHKFIDPDYYQIQYHEYGNSNSLREIDDPIRHRGRDLQSLFAYDKDNIWLKKWILRRLFRIKKDVQQKACSTLAQMGLNEEYIALSIRRGDKEVEFAIESSLQPYLDRAQKAIDNHFGGVVPPIFVASDDCTVMSEIRGLEPNWKFVGPCDDASEENGFILSNAKGWTEEQTDKHYTKFLTEMIAMASAKHFIGVSTTNVSFWVYFMRHMSAKDDTWEFVDSNLFPF